LPWWLLKQSSLKTPVARRKADKPNVSGSNPDALEVAAPKKRNPAKVKELESRPKTKTMQQQTILPLTAAIQAVLFLTSTTSE